MRAEASELRAAVRAAYPQALAGPVLAALDDAERATVAVDAVADAVADGETVDAAFRAVGPSCGRSWQWARNMYYACGGGDGGRPSR